MSTWVKTVESGEVEEGASYFIARRPINQDCPTYYFISRDMKGKTVMSTKPGLAVRYVGSDSLKEILLKHPDHVAVKVPANADKRWKRRKPVFNIGKKGGTP